MGKYSVNKLPFEILINTASKHRDLRKKAKLSQTELAERSGVSLGSIKRFETTGQISLESFLKLLHILGRLDDFDGILEPGDNMEEIENLFSNKYKR
ncbi:MAG: helix-turn-helix transcriptional regulator [Bacteroidetes bacterium]|nr:helix-turn-helix transcriptional regulator [Bacteroidota bacterium]